MRLADAIAWMSIGKKSFWGNNKMAAQDEETIAILARLCGLVVDKVEENFYYVNEVDKIVLGVFQVKLRRNGFYSRIVRKLDGSVVMEIIKE